MLFVRAGVEALPGALAGVADHVTVVLPWGSLLSAVLRPDPAVLAGLRAACAPGALLSIVVSLSERDASEIRRLGLAPLEEGALRAGLAGGYAAAGFTLDSVRPLGLDELARWPSTWARRLAHGRPRPVYLAEAGAGPPRCP